MPEGRQTAEIKLLLEQLLKEEGFKRRGSVWSKDLGHVWAAANIQKSTRGDYFYLNLGVHLKQLAKKPPSRIALSHLEIRAGNLMPHKPLWERALDAEKEIDWPIREQTIQSLFREHVLPFFRKYSDLETVTSEECTYDKGRSTTLPLPKRELLEFIKELRSAAH